MPKPFSIFISYAHEDAKLCEELKRHLSSLKHNGVVSLWRDGDISPGTDWEEKILTQLNHADIILLLISADFLNSEFCRSKEMAKAIERHEANTARVVPIIVRSTFWKIERFAKLQALPLSDERRPLPVTSWSLHDDAWEKVVSGIYEVANDLEQKELEQKKLANERASNVLGAFHRQVLLPKGNAKQFSLLLSSPDDIVKERQVVQRIVEKLNHDSRIGTLAQISIESRGESSPSLSHPMSAVAPINEAMSVSSAYDIVVIVLWSKMGQPLPADFVKEDGIGYESSVEWDFENAINGAKRNDGRPVVLVYHCNRPVMRPNETNIQEKLAQFAKVKRFFTQFDEDPLYEDIEQFAALFEAHLRLVIPTLVTKVPPANRPERSEQGAQGLQSTTAKDDDLNDLIQPYLNWVIEKHHLLELRGLGGDTQLPTIELEHVYVALKAHRANAYEREQSQELLRSEISDMVAELGPEVSATQLAEMMLYAEQQAIKIHPFMPSLIERDRPSELSTAGNEKASVTITLSEAFRKERWIVILGDPGSGKTTLVRWIALKLAAAWLSSEHSDLSISQKQIDQADHNIHFGPPRLPILLRISEFSKEYQKAIRHRETLSLTDFLGHHSWLEQYPNLSKEKLNALIKYYLRLGRAVVLLDGMDEIIEAGQRDDVVRAIEVFINDWINARGEPRSAQEKALLWSPLVEGEPAQTGGNQIVITSRITGYHARPITGQVTHVTIQPMSRLAVEQFCEAWTLAVHKQLNPKDESETVRNQAAKEAKGLKEAIFDPKRPRIRELASNPLLITILALVYRQRKGHLPEQRVKLYHDAMEILIEAWRITGVTMHELIYVLSPLAAHIHQHYSTGLIEKGEMKEIIRDELARYSNLDVSALPPSFVLKVDLFVRKVEEEVGLLVERSNGLYGFLHLTFQEYLAALFLIRDQEHAPQALIEKLDDTRWHEPILMALGHISIDDDWGTKDQQRLLTALLDVDDPLGNLVPRSTLLIVSAMVEMARVSEEVMREVIRRLLLTYADRDGIGQFATLRERIRKSFKTIYHSEYRRFLEEFLKEAILRIETGDRSIALASASLIAENTWQSDQIITALLAALPYDDQAWNYPITQSLRAFVLSATEELHPPAKPEMQPEDRQELDRLEQLIQEIRTGNRKKHLGRRIQELESQVALRRQKLEQALSDLKMLEEED